MFRRYSDNGGSTLAIAGADFAIMAGDTRHTSGYSINTRMSPKVFKIGGTTADQKDATIVLVDIYSIKYDVITNPSIYGMTQYTFQ